MRLVTFAGRQGKGIGVLQSDYVVDLRSVDNRFTNDISSAVESLACRQDEIQDLLGRATPKDCHPINSIAFETPISQSCRIFCLGLNYLEHLREGLLRDTMPSYPTVFIRVATSFVAHDQLIK